MCYKNKKTRLFCGYIFVCTKVYPKLRVHAKTILKRNTNYVHDVIVAVFNKEASKRIVRGMKEYQPTCVATARSPERPKVVPCFLNIPQ